MIITNNVIMMPNTIKQKSHLAEELVEFVDSWELEDEREIVNLFYYL